MIRHARAWRLEQVLGVGVVLATVACGGERDRPDAAGRPVAAESVPVTAPRAVPATPTSLMIARGDSIFHGRLANGICFTCHGTNAQGGQLAPNLADDQWLNTDGSMQGIVDVVARGVPQPKQFPAPMPPMGGSDLGQDDLIAVAGYVYSLSHR